MWSNACFYKRSRRLPMEREVDSRGTGAEAGGCFGPPFLLPGWRSCADSLSVSVSSLFQLSHRIRVVTICSTTGNHRP